MKRITAAVFSCLFASVSVFSCTIFMVAQEDSVLVGNNLDVGNYYPRVWFIPPSEGRHGRMCFGTDRNFKIAEGGVNDQGLYISVNALDEDSGWTADPNLKDWEEWEGWFVSGVPDGILAMCATVEEAVAVFKSYNLFTFKQVKFLLADRSGRSVVIEWSRGALRFLEREGSAFQVSTNFVTSNFAPDAVPCYRYKTAVKMFEGCGERVTVDFMRGVLSATHLEFTTPTIYSNICNLRTGEVHLYYFHNFEEAVVLNLNEKLKEGRTEYLVRDLFSVKPYVAQVYEDFAKRSSG